MTSGFRWMFLSLGLGMLCLIGLQLSSMVMEDPSHRLLLETRQAAASGRQVAPERAAELSIQSRRQNRLHSIALQATMVAMFAGISFGASRLAAAQGRRIPQAVWLAYALIAASLILWMIGVLRSDRILDEMDRLAFGAAVGDSSLLSDRHQAVRRWWNWAGSVVFVAAVVVLLTAVASLNRQWSSKPIAAASR